MHRKNRVLPKHILVIRTSAMGDVAMLAHALRALMCAYPDVKITVATRSAFIPFFEGLNVNFLAIDTKKRHKGLVGLFSFALEARSLGIDAVADVHGVLRSKIIGLWLRLFGIRSVSIDKGRDDKHDLLGCSVRQGEITPLKHTVLRYCDVFRCLGFDFADPEPVARTVCRNAFGHKEGVWIGFAPFSAQRSKTYPLDMSAELVDMLADRCERVFIHGGGGEEAAFAERMQSQYPNVTALHNITDLAGEIDLISNLDCVVSMDSLVMHLASLVATPVVSVWGATHPALGFLGYGCDLEGVVQVGMECRPCSVYGNKPCKYGDYRCIHAVTPQMIMSRVEHILAKNGTKKQEL